MCMMDGDKSTPDLNVGVTTNILLSHFCASKQRNMLKKKKKWLCGYWVRVLGIGVLSKTSKVVLPARYLPVREFEFS